MFRVNEDLSIHVTRGDFIALGVCAEVNGEDYLFTMGDVVRMTVFEKKGCHSVVLQKSFTVIEDCNKVAILLDGDDTKIGDVISKPRDYWYEVELNPETYPQTIIGYDANGPKIFRLYPEGEDIR